MVDTSADVTDRLSRYRPDRAILFRHARIMTLDPQWGDLEDSDLLVVGNRVEAIGRELEAPDGAEIVDATGSLLMPGFSDAHRHCWQGSLRRIITEAQLPQYMAVTHDGVARHFRPEDMYAGNLAALLGALDHGFTSVLDLSHNTRSRAHADAVFEAYRDSGIRAIHASAPPNAGEWEEHWPGDLERLREIAADEELITLRMAIDMRRVKPIEELIAIARQLGLGIHIDGAMGAGTSDELASLGRAGLLGPDVTVVHATSLADSAWEEMQRAGTHVVLATTSDEQLGLAGAIPPVQRLMDYGMRGGLSVDVEISLAGDPFTQMRATLLTQRMLATADAMAGAAARRLLESREVLEWAILGGAEAAGIDDQVGSLAPGMMADLLVVDLEDIAAVPVRGNLAGLVVHGIDRANIRGVLVGGRVRKWNGRLLGVDVGAVSRRAEESRAYLFDRAGFWLTDQGLQGVGELTDPSLRDYLGSHDDHVAGYL